MGSTKFTHFFSSLLCRKNKADLEMSEGVGNPVYDTFNEGQPLEDVSYFIHLKGLCHSCLVRFSNYTNYAALFALELDKLLVNDKITASCQNKYISQALYQRLQTTKIMNFEILLRPARFQNPQLQSVQYSSIRPSNLLYYLCYLHILFMF